MRRTEAAEVEEERMDDDDEGGGAGTEAEAFVDDEGVGVAASRRVLRRGAILEMKSSVSAEERKVIWARL